MSITVKLSYEERILNALANLKHPRSDNVIARGKREFDAIRAILAPLYEEAAAREQAEQDAAVQREALMHERQGWRQRALAAEQERDRLRSELQELIDHAEDMRAYVPEYFQEKWGHKEAIVQARVALEQDEVGR